MTAADEPFPHGTILVLGLVTIVAYGAWYYAFGVLLDPILTETGWPEAAVTGSFSVSVALGSVGAVWAGRLADRLGSRPVLLAGALAGPAGLLLAAATSRVEVFAVGSVVGGASLQAFGFYHITQATAARAAPHQPARAIGRLTIYGAFSSPLALPLAGWGVTTIGWRPTLRWLALATGVVMIVGALLVREREQRTASPPAGGLRAGLGSPLARRFVAGYALIGLSVGMILVYQVPLMVGAGLSVGMAAWMAGARGAAQITGRIPLSAIVERLGARRTVRLAFAVIAAGVLVLALSGTVVVALIYVALAGFGIGAVSPLLGIYGSELVERSQLGAALGFLTMVGGLAGAAGPAVAGVLAQATGTRWWGVALALVGALAAVALMGPVPETEPAPAVGPSVSGNPDRATGW
ncbi:MAG: MFS transporter [Acidimicrobiales bacterium]